jgi:hypothetical protein
VRVQLTVGSALVLVQLARNPNVAVALGASAPFQVSLRTVTLELAWVSWPPHNWVITWPLAKVHFTVQLVLAVVPVFFTSTEPWKPPLQLFVTVYVAEQAPVPPPGLELGLGDALGLRLGEELGDGEDEGDEDGEDDGDDDGDDVEPVGSGRVRSAYRMPRPLVPR